MFSISRNTSSQEGCSARAFGFERQYRYPIGMPQYGSLTGREEIDGVLHKMRI